MKLTLYYVVSERPGFKGADYVAGPFNFPDAINKKVALYADGGFEGKQYRVVAQDIEVESLA